MKMGDPLLSIYLLFLSSSLHFPPALLLPSLFLSLTALSVFIVSVSPSFYTTLTQGQVLWGCEQQPPFPCQTCFCLPFCPSVFSLNSPLLTLQIGGCKMTNVIGAALGTGSKKGFTVAPDTPHPSLWLKERISSGQEHPCLCSHFSFVTLFCRINSNEHANTADGAFCWRTHTGHQWDQTFKCVFVTLTIKYPVFLRDFILAWYLPIELYSAFYNCVCLYQVRFSFCFLTLFLPSSSRYDVSLSLKNISRLVPTWWHQAASIIRAALAPRLPVSTLSPHISSK